MAEKTAKKTAKVPSQRARTAAKKTAKAAAPKTAPKTAVARTTEVSEDVLKSVEGGQRAAIDAVRTFVDRIDEALPDIAGSARRQSVIDAALELADRLVTAQYDFLRSMVREANRALTRSEKKK